MFCPYTAIYLTHSLTTSLYPFYKFSVTLLTGMEGMHNIGSPAEGARSRQMTLLPEQWLDQNHVSSEPSAFQSSRNSPNFPTEDELNLEAIMEHNFKCIQILLKYFQKWDSRIYHLNVNCLCRSTSSLCGYGL